MVSRRLVRAVTAVVLILTLPGPLPVWSAVVSLGTARGVHGVELSLDDGKSWLPLTARPLPLMDGTQVRSRNGGAVLDLGEGSRVNLLPFSALRLRSTGAGTEVSLVYGRVTFQLPAQTRVELRTPAARLEAVRTAPMHGELFVAREGTMGLQLKQGSLQVRELSDAKPVRLASTEPVFLPKRPATSAPLFTIDASPAAALDGAKAVFGPRGESLGYLRPDAQLVVHPGYSSDLTQPFAPRLIQLAMAKIPDRDRSDATPVFDVNGGYVGYLAGPAFYAQAQLQETQLAQVPPSGPPLWVPFLVLGGILVGGAIVIGTGESGDGGDTVITTATPLRPRR